MKYLFCGLGSIGQRHLNNLIDLGEKDIVAFRQTDNPLRSIKKNVRIFKNIESVLNQKVDAAFITNPSSLHIPLATKLAEHGCNLFIEKPLSTNLSGVKYFKKLCERQNLIVAVGFMTRFHPAVKQIKKWLSDNIIGYPISARIELGSYLPNWHPWENYTKSYSGNADLGGGPIFTLCHEFDILNFFFGEPESIFSFSSKKSSLKINTEVSAEVLLQYKSGLIAEVHLDYLQNPPSRKWEILGDKGKIEFDYYKNELTMYNLKNNKSGYQKKTVNYVKFERNDMFVAELKHFIHCLKTSSQPETDLVTGIINLKIIVAAHQSIKEKRVVKMSELKI